MNINKHKKTGDTDLPVAGWKNLRVEKKHITMKNLKIVLTIVLTGLLSLTMNSCKKCKGEAPRARIVNNGTQKADVQVKTSNGNTVNINNVASGTVSSYSSYAAGQVTFTINVANTNYVKTVDVANCYDYEIIIDASNNIAVTAIDRNK